jgi:hypothetical protein
MTFHVARSLIKLTVLSYFMSEPGENALFRYVAAFLSIGLMYTRTTDSDVFTNGYPLHCSPLMYTNVSCCALFLVTIPAVFFGCVLFTCQFVLRLVSERKRNCAYEKRLPVQHISRSQLGAFDFESWWRGSNGQFVLDLRRVKHFSLDQITAFLLDEGGPKNLWLERNNCYLWPVSTRGYAFRPVLKFRCAKMGFIWLFQRKAGGNAMGTCWLIVDLLMSLGTPTGYFELCGFSSDLKLFSTEGLRTLLRKSPNIATLKFHDMFLDTECCRLFGNLRHSPLKLSFPRCKFENSEAFGDGMRKNGGPTELTYTGAASSGNSLWKSFGSLEANTKLQSIILKTFIPEERDLKEILPALSARNLKRIELIVNNSLIRQACTPRAWTALWKFLSGHPSVTTVRVFDNGFYDPAPVAAALRNNFIITTIAVKKIDLNDAAFWKEHVHAALKRNRKLTHLSRVYHLVRENPHSLAHVVWDVDRAADSADRGMVIDNATLDE